MFGIMPVLMSLMQDAVAADIDQVSPSAIAGFVHVPITSR
jgi:hypothetical protein